MKKKIKYIILIISLCMFNNTVNAINLFGNFDKKDVCGLSLPNNVPTFTHGLFNVVKILVPIILIIMGMIDFAKAVMAQDEKKMKDSKDSFIRRLIAAIFIFLIVAIVQFVFSKVSSDNGFNSCMKCILNNECADSTEDYGASTRTGNNQNSETTTITITESTCSVRGTMTCTKSKDATGATCEVVNNKCRTKCSSESITKKKDCPSHCEWKNNKCKNKTSSSSSSSTSSSSSSSNSTSPSTTTSGKNTSNCLLNCERKIYDSAGKTKCQSECNSKQTKISCSECNKITSSTASKNACLKNCKPN